LIQHLHLPRTEIRKRVVVHRHAAANPHVSDVLFTQPVQLAGAADTAQGSIQPKCKQNPRVGGWVARSARDGGDLVVNRRQIQPFDEFPYDPRLMIVGQHIVQRARPKLDLVPNRASQPRLSALTRLLGTGCRIDRRHLEQKLVVHCRIRPWGHPRIHDCNQFSARPQSVNRRKRKIHSL
jgi:hypothetical protein